MVGRIAGPRRPLVVAAALVAVVAAALAVGTAVVGTVGSAQVDDRACTAVDPDARYTFDERFDVDYERNQQGLAYADGVHYVGFDVDDGEGRIVAYDDDGEEVDRTPRLPLGHAAELSHREADGNLYVAIAGDGEGLRVGVVDMRPDTPRLLRTYDFTRYGDSGMVAIDNARDRMVVKSGPRRGPHTFTTTDMEGRVLEEFTDESQGTGQGLEVVGGCILLYTSAPGFTHNTITAYDLDGDRVARIRVPVAEEGEGLSVDPRTGEVHVGFRAHEVHTMSPRLRTGSRG